MLITSEHIESLKNRQMTKDVYLMIMRSYRFEKALILNAKLNEKELRDKFRQLNKSFQICEFKINGIDKYHPDFCFSWVVKRVMNKMNLSARKALELADKFRVDTKAKTDYAGINERIRIKNKHFYSHKLNKS
ncbi:hypothetical protein [Vibrio cholerae]|uniref:hypothetical protein n=1 Tax=Vibrio cholerae TaxID=666 RepID=UPI000E0BEB30|nr:hypothetical protein [Vibrio cholerae]EGZ6890516.1 hypothetical protein [Vibrio cholerae]HBC2020446.1 hypothetical protein [Vibrio cholerae]